MSTRRKYDMTKRAESQAETRQRITVAAMELHGSVGPAKTTISAVAERAGVQRITVYRHFADEAALFEACSSHWLSENPLPDPTTWPDLRIALEEMYAFYDRNEAMIGNLLRDRDEVKPIEEAMKGYDAYIDAASELLAKSDHERAVVGHALEFETWRSLTRRRGLSRQQAVDLMLFLRPEA